MSLEATRQALEKAKVKLEKHQAALRTANVEIERRNQGMLALTAYIHQLNHAAGPTELLKLALMQALQIARTSIGAIVLIDPETKALHLGVQKDLSPELHRILTGQQLAKGATTLMPHLVAGSGALLEYHSDDEAERHLLATSRLTALVSLPLRIGSKLLGALLVGLQQEHRSFSPAELHFLMILSQETATALENLYLRDGLWHTAEVLLTEGTHLKLPPTQKADSDNVKNTVALDLSDAATLIPEPAADDLEQLLVAMMEAEGEVQQQNTDLQTLNIVSELMNRTLDLKKILQCAVEETQATLNTNAAWLYLVDEADLLIMQAHTGLSTDDVRGMQQLKLGEGLEGCVASENKVHLITSVSNDGRKPKIRPDKEKLQALAAVPITRPTREATLENKTDHTPSHVVGVLATAKHTGQTWTPREIRLLTAIANQVALAVDNARLYDQVHEKERYLSSGNEVLRNINDMLLEKNAYLEGFINDDLPQALTEISQIIQYLMIENPTPLAEQQKNKIAHLQNIVHQLGELTTETSTVSTVLDTEFDKSINETSKQNTYSGTAKPVRLHRSEADEVKPEKPEPNQIVENDEEVKPMSFAEAVAAGLVPAHIKSREAS